MAKATKNPRNNQIWVLVGIVPAMRCKAAQSKVPCPSRCPLTTNRPITLASMTNPPSSEYKKNFTAAYCRLGPPKRPIRKYIGTSMTSKNR